MFTIRVHMNHDNPAERMKKGWAAEEHIESRGYRPCVPGKPDADDSFAEDRYVDSGLSDEQQAV